MEYKCSLISVGDLWKDPELIHVINDLLFDSRIVSNQEKSFYCRLFNDSTNFVRPDIVAIFTHENTHIGCCTLLLETNKRSNIIIENLCVLPHLKRNKVRK